MSLKRTLFLVVAAGLALAASAQDIPPVPKDPLEVVTGPVEVADTPESRQDALELLDRARENYAIRNSGRSYQLKVSFTVNSGGETLYDGAWQMEETFVPHVGLRWTAQAAAGYKTTQISAKRESHAEGTSTTVPLRLHEARAALFGPIATRDYSDRSLIRTSSAVFHGVSVMCVLLSASGSPATPTPGRRWEESEECINPQSGLLQVHSLAPGSYLEFDYTDGPILGGHKFPKKVTETEGGKTVMVLQVDSLTEADRVDPQLFEPTAAMTSGPPGVALGEARKISFVADRSTASNGAGAVCVLGVIAPSGELLEAHSLQSGDPRSGDAVAMAKRLKLGATAAPGSRPVQRFAFIIVKFGGQNGAQSGGQP